MRQDVIICARLTAAAFGVCALAACSSMMSAPTDHAGSTSLAPAVTGTNSSDTTQGPPNSGEAPNPPTSVTQPH